MIRNDLLQLAGEDSLSTSTDTGRWTRLKTKSSIVNCRVSLKLKRPKASGFACDARCLRLATSGKLIKLIS